MIRNRKLLKAIAVFLLLQFSSQILFPTISYALTSGPSQPEFSSFEPVATTNMVDEFTGDFIYNLPLLEVPGPHGGSYPLSLSYHGGVTPEEEASWVGYGWTLNAGAINRTVRGIPDDSKGENIITHNKTPENWTVTLGASAFLEVFSKDQGMFTPSIGATYRYNNYRGFGLIKRFGLILGRGLVNMGYSVDEGSGSFSLNVSPMSILNKPVEYGKKESEKSSDKEFKARDAFKSYFRSKSSTTLNSITSFNLGSKYGIFTYNQGSVMPTYVSSYTGSSVNVSGTFNIDPTPLPIGTGFNLMGSFSYQRNKPYDDKSGYGYLYSSFATKDDMMDYHMEKDNPYDKQDEFIGMPFNDADQFIVTGEGIGGGFRLYTPTVGHFGPTEVSSKYDILQISPELEAGLNWGGGTDVGVGRHTFQITDWKRDATTFPNFESQTIDEPAFFRFNNDLGGSWGEKSKYNDAPVRFSVSSGLPTYSGDFAINNNLRGGRSSHIGFHTNKQINDDVANITKYSKRNWNFFVDRTLDENKSKIGELAVTNEDGFRYVYALPVYGKSERNLNVGLPDQLSGAELEKNFIAYKKKESVLKIGQERAGKYAYSYLLTEIMTPDYIDRLRDGVTSDDFGGYVRFGYHKIYGDQSQKAAWYGWRIPYNGVSYQRNTLSDKKDDMGTLVSGQKEIYYLKTVETKTHVAIFYFSDRTDGLGALDDEAAMTKGAKSAHDLKKLDKIELYSINSMGTITRDASGNIPPPVATVKPIKTVHFQYAPQGQELMTGAPNNTTAARGRLTLQKVYFAYNSIVQAKLSPYQFEYKYPTVTYPDGVSTEKYSDFDNMGASISNALYGTDDPENPKYNPFNVDAWGNFQLGSNQYEKMRTWTDQKLIPNLDFDPAPWHLKKIVLPSGGEIHVQYEQDDYQYVQDQDAHIMAQLLIGQPVSHNKIYIDLTSMGVNPSDVNAKNFLKKLITNRYVGQKKKIYFKFLYTLKGTSQPSLNSCNAEYITGYSKVSGVDYDATGFYVTLGDDRLPKDVRKDFIYAHVIGRVNETNCARTTDMIENNGSGSEKSKALAMIGAFFSATASALTGLASGYDGNTINPSLSYLRVPTVNPKKGGGIRVKRLLMYDNSLDGKVLYGNAYTYTTQDTDGRPISSGVATNEPNREENILVEYIPKKRQNWTNKIVAGKDKEVSEGPLGETIYPGPSVGYSRIITTNIHSAKTNPGFSVSEYYTARDFPVKVTKTDIAGNSKYLFKLGIFANKFINNQTAVQGYSMIVNNMHGQLKKKASYSGDYSSGVDLTKSTLVSEQVIDYFAPGEDIPVLSQLSGQLLYKSLGREVDFTLAQRSISEKNIDGNTEVDFTAGTFGPFLVPFISLMGSITKTESLLNTHVTTKVVRYPSIVRKVTTYQDGIYHTDEYVAFNELNGKPVAVKSEDEFKGAYLNQSIPAGWEYNNFKQKATNENMTVVDASGANMLYPPVNGRHKFELTGSNACTRITQLAIGDLLKLIGSFSYNYFHVESIDYGSSVAWLVPSSYNNGSGSMSGPSSVYTYTILESGRNNQLNQSAGNIIFHDPVSASLDLSTPAVRYVITPFTTDLETAFEAAATSFTLINQYNNMNMAAYSSYLPACVVDWTNASIKNVAFVKVVSSSTVTLRLSSFQILCASGWVTVQR